MGDVEDRVHGFWKAFGPGLMWAAAAIGVSHLVQSTRAGAMAGFGLAGVILIALVLKYPFFEYGPRYAAATGRSLVEGYRDIGAWALWLYFLMTLVTAVIHQLAILLFMSFLVRFAFGIDWPVWMLGGAVYGGCVIMLVAGRFRGFDYAVKFVVAALAVSTLVAAAVAAPQADWSTIGIWPLPSTGIRLGFLLALVGFMPSAVEVSVMSSLWTLAKDRTVEKRTSVALARLDFQVGYAGTAVLAFAFLLLGATVMYGSGQEFSEAGPVFSTQLVELYTRTLGSVTRPLVMVAVLTTIFSTTLVVIDGFPRAIERCVRNIVANSELGVDVSLGRSYWLAMLVFGGLNMVGLSLFTDGLTPMIDFATIFTFATAPVLGYLNLRAVTSIAVPKEHRPGDAMLLLTYLGLGLLGGTTVIYLASRLFSFL
ncbi:MAG: NRAMP family divalent metal transporter [Gemmatimonadales bacterium]